MTDFYRLLLSAKISRNKGLLYHFVYLYIHTDIKEPFYFVSYYIGSFTYIHKTTQFS